MAFIPACLVSMILSSAPMPQATPPNQDVPTRQATPRDRPQLIELPGVPDWLGGYDFEQAAFTFVRIRYDPPAWAAGRMAMEWATDFPDAELNLVAQLGHLTRLDVSEPILVLRPTDPELANHPFAYLSQPGRLALNDAEVVAMRNYLEGGGFLLIDDSWGDFEWDNLLGVLKRVFPDRTPDDLPLDHPIFHCAFDLKEKPQIWSIHSFTTGAASELADANEPRYAGISDESGRLMVLICHNTDLADGWERVGVDERYTREMSQKAFPMGINAIVYALTRGDRGQSPRD